MKYNFKDKIITNGKFLNLFTIHYHLPIYYWKFKMQVVLVDPI
jgi:hypothetical protein